MKMQRNRFTYSPAQIVLFFCVFLLSSCEKVTNRFYLENDLVEEVQLIAKDSEGNILSEKRVLANERLLILATTTRDSRSIPTVDDALFELFDNMNEVHSIDFVFVHNSRFTMNLSSIDQPELYILDLRNWISESVGKNESERIYSITQAHKDAAQ